MIQSTVLALSPLGPLKNLNSYRRNQLLREVLRLTYMLVHSASIKSGNRHR